MISFKLDELGMASSNLAGQTMCKNWYFSEDFIKKTTKDPIFKSAVIKSGIFIHSIRVNLADALLNLPEKDGSKKKAFRCSIGKFSPRLVITLSEDNVKLLIPGKSKLQLEAGYLYFVSIEGTDAKYRIEERLYKFLMLF